MDKNIYLIQGYKYVIRHNEKIRKVNLFEKKGRKIEYEADQTGNDSRFK